MPCTLLLPERDDLGSFAVTSLVIASSHSSANILWLPRACGDFLYGSYKFKHFLMKCGRAFASSGCVGKSLKVQVA